MVTFIIPVRNDAQRLQRCLASVAANPGVCEVIVVDNGSTDASPMVARAAGARVLSAPGKTVAELRNEAAAIARGELLAFVDADHEIAASWVAAALDVMQPAEVGGAGALYVAPRDGNWVQRTYGALRGHTVGRGDTRWLGSGNLIVRRLVFEKLGGFDATLESCEDVDFCQRLRAAGWRLVADERLVSVHYGDPSTLGHLFRAERWRGRDNLRVTFRTRMTVRDLPSVISPIMVAVAVPVLLAASLAAPFTGGRSLSIALAAAVAFAVVAVARTARIASAVGDWRLGAVARAFAVAATYELARASAILTRAAHHRHGPAPTARAAGASAK
jgi:GT2 family glycosyltransferase